MQDGLILMYVKDGTAYPVLLTKEQDAIFKLIQQALPQPIHQVAFNLPQGKAINLVTEKEVSHDIHTPGQRQ